MSTDNETIEKEVPVGVHSPWARYPEACRLTMSGAERLRLGRSSDGNTAGQPSDDGCYENGKAWILEHGWIWQMPRSV
jgi:hypothetical protein